MAERPEDLNLPNAVITRIIKEAVGAGPLGPAERGICRPRPREIPALEAPAPARAVSPPAGLCPGLSPSGPGAAALTAASQGMQPYQCSSQQRSSRSGTVRTESPKTSAHKPMLVQKSRIIPSA